ncbi:MAG: TIGR01777 family oxidoreductase [Acidobacteriota bacterium]
MKIVIAGGTGFLGRPLASTLVADGHEVVHLTRGSAASGADGARLVTWTPNGGSGPWAEAVEGAGAVVNLAGESIAGKRWSAAQKQQILESRVFATRSLAEAIRGAAVPPPVFVSGSAVGYYGPRGDDIVTEDTTPGSDFLAGVCVQWEQEAQRAEGPHTRVVCVRTGLVLERDGGALPPMLLPFKMGVGGPVGSGRQYWPWIHRVDWVALVRWVIRTGAVTGPVNATAPTPSTNADFAGALGRALHRPALLPTPAFALRLLLGDMADALVLSGQRAIPAKAERLGFTFTHPHLEEAFASIFRRD